MPKRSTKSGGHLPPLEPPLHAIPSQTSQKQHLATALAGVFLVGYIFAAYALMPRELPVLAQRFAGLVCAGLAVFVFWAATRPTESPEEALLRARHAHSDFGKRLREKRAKRGLVKLPGVGEVRIRVLGAVAVLLVVGLWWLTPLAPVGVKAREIEDLSGPLGDVLGEEIMAAALAMPNAQFAVLQAPVVPPRARQLGKAIVAEADTFQRGLKALVEGRFATARALLSSALEERGSERHQVLLAQAQNEMYAGRFLNAMERYDRALKLKPDSPVALCQAAVAAMQAGEFAKAEPLISRALRLTREKASESDPAAAYCLHIHAIWLMARGRQYDYAQQICAEARAIFEKAQGHQYPLVAASLNNQATLYLIRANYRGAEELYRRAGDVWNDAFGPFHPHAAAGLRNLALVYFSTGQYAEARGLLQQARAVRQKGPADQEINRALDLSAGAAVELALPGLGDDSRPPEKILALAEQDLQQALALTERELGSEHANVAPIAETLADCCVQQARYAKAEVFYLRALSVSEKAWGARHPYTASVLNRLAELYLTRGQLDMVGARCEPALEISKEALGEKHPSVAAELSTLARLKIRRQDPQARAALQQARQILEAEFEQGHPEIARLMGQLASLYNIPAAYAEGVVEYKKAITMAKDRLGAVHPEVAELLFGLALFHERAGRFADAVPCLKEALAIREKSLVPSHPDLAVTLEKYAEVLLKLTPPDPQQAAALQSRAKAVREKHALEDRAE